MTKAKRDKIIYSVCRNIVTQRGDKGIRDSYETVCTELGIDGAFTLKTSEIPFLFEVKHLWEPKRNIAGRRILLDYSNSPEWKMINPFADGDKGKTCVVNDSQITRFGPITNDFIDSVGIRAYVVSVLISNNEYVGATIYFCMEPHEWSEEEISILNAAASYIASEVGEIRREESQSYLLKESERMINEANDAKSQFMTNLSHEIRTPINAVIGMISIMRHNLGSAEVLSECLERMEKSSKQLMDMINDCVDMTLINSGEMAMNLNWVPVNALLAGVRNVIEPLALGRNQNFEIECDESMTIYGDEVKMGRVLINCLSNSCRHAEGGTNIYLTITTGKVGGKDMVIFRIRDEVTGIDEEAAKRIFEPFGGERYHDSLKGNGLNMTIVKHLVDLMNGKIDFFSDGWGTEVVASLPFATRGGRNEEPAVENAAADSADYAEMYIGRRILIAEDNVLMGEILATILGYRGLETDTALNGQEAFDRFSAHEPFYYDMILMDIQMPVMNGIDATKAIRACDRADSNLIPIVALSANAYKEDEERAIAAGMNMYLRKPVGEKELLEAISNLVL